MPLTQGSQEFYLWCATVPPGHRIQAAEPRPTPKLKNWLTEEEVLEDKELMLTHVWTLFFHVLSFSWDDIETSFRVTGFTELDGQYSQVGVVSSLTRYIVGIIMEAFCSVLEELYKKVLLGDTLEKVSHDYIFYLSPARSDPASPAAPSLEWPDTSGVQGPRKPSSIQVAAILEAPVRVTRNCQMNQAQEVALFQLTVIKVMITRIFSLETEIHAKEEYRDIIKILLQSAEIDSKLICMLQTSDKLLSHMAAKCLASLVYFQLKEKITLSKSWIAFCHKNLSEYSESGEVIHCLWTLSVVIKEILKDTCSEKTEILKQFLAPFDATFEVFYNSLFSQHFENCQDPGTLINSLVCFLELLELLTASRIYLKLHCQSQRILFLNPRVLDVLSWPVPAFVKRRLIVLIKKCLLCKVGEDLCRGAMPAFTSPDRHLDTDMLALADTVLHAVHGGLLKTFSVHGKPSCFGGDEVQPGCGQRSGPDHVTLRAASLVTVKSLEITLQNCTSANEVKAGVQRFMSELLAFLKPRLQPPLQLHHPCEWLSRVFIEQDDDMLEAARASLSIYVKLTREWEPTGSLTQDKEAWIRHAHENGYHPHCVFLIFLRNIGFDSTVLLDFLISSETCFLEYFVRYLKLLQKDWDHFLTTCQFCDVAQSSGDTNHCGCAPLLVHNRSTNHTVPRDSAAPDSHTDAHPCISRASDESSVPLNQVMVFSETRAPGEQSLPSPQAPQSLVDYGSSEDSDVESTDQCLSHSKKTSSHQEAMKTVPYPAGTRKAEKQLSLENQSGLLVPEEPNTLFSADREVAPDNAVSEVGLFHRTVRSFEELQGAISRLQKKNLFPYNPAALLKLLKRIEALYNKV